MNITEIGFDWLIDSIKEHQIEPPEGMTVTELQGWLNGYAEAQGNILEVIDEFRKGQKN